MSAQAESDLPLDAVLMRLGETYSLAGRDPDALETFKRVADEFPESPYAADARREVEELEAAGVEVASPDVGDDADGADAAAADPPAEPSAS